MKLKILSLALVAFCSIELSPQKMGDAYALNINNIYLPLNRDGVLADVDAPPIGPGGQFGGHTFLFSGGFFLSGYSNGQLWANAVASASRVQDYIHGTYLYGQNDLRAQLYKVSSEDPPFGQSWLDWIDAVALGADFYDGNEDGIYNPVDLNGNGLWDWGEDRPDLLGDEMMWCVFHDAVPSPIRRWADIEPQGIEIRQTVFAYSTVPELQNVIFVRYRIYNTGMVANEMTNVYFGIWDDSDLGDYMDDLAGCDTLLTGGYTYNDGPDSEYGSNPPSFLAKLLSGPVTYIPGETFIDNNGNGKYDEGIDTPLDTAYVHRGQILGIKEYPGAKNQGLSSFIHYMQSHPQVGDPNYSYEARNYMLGLDKNGDPLNPCTWTFGQVRGGVPCNQVNNKFWYSGDPVTNIGWINTYPTDQRQMLNIGPFTLEKDNHYEVFAAYNVGQGTSALSSITEVKNISIQSQGLYDLNFDPSGLPVWVEELSQGNYPADFTLFQNYPNPFNPTTKISWQSPVGGWQSLKVFDVLGNEVATLVDEYKPAGNYEVEWDASGFPSGVYFYQLKSGSFVETKKMILLK